MTERDCEHGRLARSCLICELQADLELYRRANLSLRSIMGQCADKLESFENQEPREVAKLLRLSAGIVP